MLGKAHQHADGKAANNQLVLYAARFPAEAEMPQKDCCCRQQKHIWQHCHVPQVPLYRNTSTNSAFLYTYMNVFM